VRQPGEFDTPTKARRRQVWAAALLVLSLPGLGRGQQHEGVRSTADGLGHQESAAEHADDPAPPPLETPPLPEGMTLDEVLERADQPPPPDFPVTVTDDRMILFTLVEQLEFRAGGGSLEDHLGWEAQGWLGTDLDKLWWKSEGEAALEGAGAGEVETDVLYSRLITPFWNAQVGAQHALEWEDGDAEDRWSGVVALQGLLPYKFEVDASLYLSEDADVTAELEAEYDIRLTQRLVLQPRTELGFAVTDIPERELGAGLTGVDLDLRVRYEVERELAPYIGLRYHFLTAETRQMAEESGADTSNLILLGGFRLAF
jgi:copper resistance protein B